MNYWPLTEDYFKKSPDLWVTIPDTGNRIPDSMPPTPDSPLPFPDSGILLMWIRIDRFKVKPFLIQASGIRMRGSVMR